MQQQEQQHQVLSETLAAILGDASAGKALTLNELLERTQGRSIYLLIIILCLPFLIPLSVPGLSTIMGSIIMWLMFRQVLGKPPRLPRVLGEHQLSAKVQRRLLSGSIKVLQVLERLIKPRRTQWLAWRWAVVVNSFLIALLGFLLALPLPSPPFFLSNTIPGYAIVVLAASIMEEDGVMIWFGYTLVLLNIVFFGLLAGVIVELFLKLWKSLSHSSRR